MVQPFESTCITRQPTAFSTTRIHVRHKDPDTPNSDPSPRGRAQGRGPDSLRLGGGRLNCVITCVSCKADFVSALQQDVPHVIFTDYTISGFDGLSALTIAQEHDPDIPFIFVSGTILDEAGAITTKAGTDYVLKGRLSRLMPSVSRALREAGAKAERRRAEERFRLVSRVTTDAVWDWNFVTNVVWRNEGFRVLMGESPGADGHALNAWAERIHPQDRERIDQACQAVMSTGQTQWADEYRVRRADGSYAWVMERGYLLRDEQGRPVRMIGSMIDATGLSEVGVGSRMRVFLRADESACIHATLNDAGQ